MYTLFATIQNQERQAKSQTFTAILLILIRLAAHQTDVVITINVPHVEEKYIEGNVNLEAQQLGPQLEEAVQMRDEILKTFQIKDWSLFGGHAGESDAA